MSCCQTDEKRCEKGQPTRRCVESSAARRLHGVQSSSSHCCRSLPKDLTIRCCFFCDRWVQVFFLSDKLRFVNIGDSSCYNLNVHILRINFNKTVKWNSVYAQFICKEFAFCLCMYTYIIKTICRHKKNIHSSFKSFLHFFRSTWSIMQWIKEMVGIETDEISS